jgi:multidrug efflux pump subunit AcrA (membrane-fusion protein)
VAFRAPLGFAVLALLIPALDACSRSKDSQTGPPPDRSRHRRHRRAKAHAGAGAIGNVQPSEAVTVRARVGGILSGVRFKEGQDVREGDLLFILESRPLQAELMQAEANLAKSQAQLDTARKDAARYAELYRRGLVAQAQYEQMETQAKEAIFEGALGCRPC